MQYFQSAKSWVAEWSISPWIGSSILLYDSPFQHWKLSLTIQVWLFSVQWHKCHLNHHSNAWNLARRAAGGSLRNLSWDDKWLQMMKQRAKTDFSLKAGASWYTFEDMLVYCKLSLHCSAKVGALSNGKKHLLRQIASLTLEQQFLPQSKLSSSTNLYKIQGALLPIVRLRHNWTAKSNPQEFCLLAGTLNFPQIAFWC